MEDKVLLKIAMLTVFIGLGVLILIYEKVDVPVSGLELINELKEGDYVKVIGEINSVNVNAGMYILKIKGRNTTIPVVVFSKDRINFQEGNFIEVEGKIEDYKGKKEIIASRTILL